MPGLAARQSSTRAKRFRVLVACLGPPLALAACGGGSGGAPIAVSGSALILDPANFSRAGGGCTGDRALAAVREGATVTVDGEAAATLSTGVVTGEGNCRFRFAAELPDKGEPKIYAFSVDGLPAVKARVNTRDPIDWQDPGADGWVTIGWD